MVNSPSRPNSRPDAPPAPVDCGGLTPHWHREPCHPVQRTAGSRHPQSNQIRPSHTFRISRLPSPDLRNPGAETRFPLIQGKNPCNRA